MRCRGRCDCPVYSLPLTENILNLFSRDIRILTQRVRYMSFFRDILGRL